MKLDKKVIGIVFAYAEDEELSTVKGAGIEWLRINLDNPWKDKMFGELTEGYKKVRQSILNASEGGFKVMPSTPGLGGYQFDERQGITCWCDSWPEYVGKVGTPEFYENVKKVCAWYANDLKDIGGPLWQVMNEIDLETFHGDYPLEIAAETAFQSAVGIVSVDSDAICGINLSGYCEEGF